MFSAAARASKLLRTHNASLPDATRLYRQTPPRYPRSAPRHLPPTPPPPLRPAQQHATSTAAAVGLASGTLGAMCGVGGAIFSVPALVRFASLSQRAAGANSLVAVTCVALTGAASLSAAPEAAIDVETAALLSVGAAAFTPLGAAVSTRVNAALLRRALGAFMLLLAPVMPLRAYLERASPRERSLTGDTRRFLLAGLGSAVGFTSGLLGISGGSLFTPIIALASPEHGFKNVLATSFASMVVPTACGAVTYARMGLVTPALVPPLVVGAVTGAAIGSTAALAVPDYVLQWTFAIVFTVMGARVLRAPIAPPTNSAKAAIVSRTVAPPPTTVPSA
ncbi:hypothetical protein BWQ96_07202 [Gracilariopsis chorda]|uniref:Membrane transporter protein n=1 Tax=Gracilariopsis chorda TaxID=448386 RepID=A0A2V3ILU3_9FLOR|nr:hypothetical protein BWQ96_07202 [Gracilariopsis chorda]|eukprot:PXF43055.1 hypothetical protein BWQ96_07202 [Gracilariopsis chorda]